MFPVEVWNTKLLSWMVLVVDLIFVGKIGVTKFHGTLPTRASLGILN